VDEIYQPRMPVQLTMRSQQSILTTANWTQTKNFKQACKKIVSTAHGYR